MREWSSAPKAPVLETGTGRSEVLILLTWIIFLFVGAIAGVIISWSLDMKSPKELLQGALGGLISGFLMSAMLPH